MAGKARPIARAGLIGTLLVAVLCGAGCLRRAMRYSDFITSTPIAPTDTLIIGFLGGRQPYDNDKEGTRRLALKLRGMELPGVHVETAENSRRELALELVERAFDRNRDGELDEAERQAARIIIYGQSFGGAAVVKLARELHERDIPVLLTVQMDSVGRGDELIPPNVRQAANLHQQDGLVIRGEKEIRAQDPERTEILGNFQFSYKDKKVDMSGVAWHKRAFRNAHAKMDKDPEVWAKVEELILGVISHRGTETQRE
jgi:hypothetical protein